MQTLKLQDYGVMPMSNREYIEIDGGGFLDWAIGVGIAVGASMIEHWGECKRGFNDGLNGVYNPQP